MMGIYCIHNLVNDKIYVGSSIDIKNRKTEHFKSLKGGYHRNKYLQRAYIKYGKNLFDFIVLEEVGNRDSLIKREQYWLDQTKSYNPEIGYNICQIAGNTMGREWSEETLIKFKEAGKKRRHPEEVKAKISNSLKGRKFSKETLEKMSKAQSGENNPMYGKEVPQETRQKLSVAGKKRKHTDETKKKMSESHKKRGGQIKEVEARFILTDYLIFSNKYGISDLVEFFNISISGIRKIHNRRTWKYIEPMSLDEFYEYEKEIRGDYNALSL